MPHAIQIGSSYPNENSTSHRAKTQPSLPTALDQLSPLPHRHHRSAICNLQSATATRGRPTSLLSLLDRPRRSYTHFISPFGLPLGLRRAPGSLIILPPSSSHRIPDNSNPLHHLRFVPCLCLNFTPPICAAHIGSSIILPFSRSLDFHSNNPHSI